MEKKVNCKVTKCIYNRKSEYCHKKEIMISGNKVNDSDDTQCESFENSGTTSYTTYKLKKEYIPQIEVYCDVNNCVFYSNGFLNGKCNRVSITLDENKGEPRCLSCKTM